MSRLSDSRSLQRISCRGFADLWCGPCPDDAATRPASDSVAQLRAGKAAGTWRLSYSAKVELGVAGHCDTTARISDYFNAEQAKFGVGPATNFTFEADLKPGSYYLDVVPADTTNRDYFPSIRHPIFIDKLGQFYLPRSSFTTPGVFELNAHMKGLVPKRGSIADEQAPLLKWDAVPGATHYQGSCMIDGPAIWFNTDEPQYVIGAGLAAGSACSFSIQAMNDQGKTLARGESAFYGHGTSAVTQKLTSLPPAMPPPGTIPLMPGPRPAHYRLGIIPFWGQAPKDLKKEPQFFAESGGTVENDALPGIEVKNVFSEVHRPWMPGFVPMT